MLAVRKGEHQCLWVKLRRSPRRCPVAHLAPAPGQVRGRPGAPAENPSMPILLVSSANSCARERMIRTASDASSTAHRRAVASVSVWSVSSHSPLESRGKISWTRRAICAAAIAGSESVCATRYLRTKAAIPRSWSHLAGVNPSRSIASSRNAPPGRTIIAEPVAGSAFGRNASSEPRRTFRAQSSR